MMSRQGSIEEGDVLASKLPHDLLKGAHSPPLWGGLGKIPPHFPEVWGGTSPPGSENVGGKFFHFPPKNGGDFLDF